MKNRIHISKAGGMKKEALMMLINQERTFLNKKGTFSFQKGTFLKRKGTFSFQKGTFLKRKGTFSFQKGTFLKRKGTFLRILQHLHLNFMSLILVNN
jgi:hypothetical protein